MYDKPSTLFEINSLLSLTELDRQRIKDKLNLFENEIQELLKKISTTINFHESEIEFKKLDEYQLIGAKLFFKYNFDVSGRLEIFIRDFDRTDDLDTRRNLYEWIKTGRYF